MKKKLYIILNPASGKAEPVLFYINKYLSKKYDWEIGLTKDTGDGIALAKKALRQKYKLIMVYGGDGTVMEVISVILNSSASLIILPGGTTNLLTREMGISQNVEEVIEQFASGNGKILAVDIVKVNNQYVAVGVTVGLTAQIMRDAQREHKNRYGRLAYGISAVKQKLDNKINTCEYTIAYDGKKEICEGVSLIVTNVSSAGIGDFSLLNSISITDGKIDIFVLQDASVLTVLELTNATIFDAVPKAHIKHIRTDKAQISFSKKQLLERNDFFSYENSLKIATLPKALKLYIPKNA